MALLLCFLLLLRLSSGVVRLSSRLGTSMALASKARRAENAPATNLYVDESCIDCATCRYVIVCFPTLSSLVLCVDENEEPLLCAYCRNSLFLCFLRRKFPLYHSLWLVRSIRDGSTALCLPLQVSIL
ncbi:unnamed protein product [Phaeothamnion confervicola]